MKIAVTGSDGFLGWHTRVRLHALTDHEVIAVNRQSSTDLGCLIKRADAIIHCAGVNRGVSAHVERENVEVARAVADALRQASSGPRVVYANSIQAGSDSPYGRGKSAAGHLLAEGAADAGGTFVDVRLPNLFGQHGRPHYNSFVATFVDAVIRGTGPDIVDRNMQLLHVQDAAQSLIDGLTARPGCSEPAGIPISVREIAETVQSFRPYCEAGEIPSLTSKLETDLFNTLCAALFPGHYPLPLTSHSDHRGRLVEIVRSRGGPAQTFVSTSAPGVSRGEHFHLTKMERFAVVTGTARISLRRLLSDEIVSFYVDGRDPVAIDIPTLWAHNITNIGDAELTTMFWTDRLFDPDVPDTYPEPVEALIR